MKQIYILDAVNFLFRSYYAIGPMTNGAGQSTSALFGFIRSIMKLIKDFGPEHLVCVFDGPDNKKSRQAVYAEYKMHRKGAPEDLFPQFDWAAEYCELAGISTLCVEGVEADDTMAAVAVWAKKKGAQVFLCSGDKDLMQLVDDQIKVLQTHKDNLIIDAKKVEEIYGVRPDQILDLLAIMGDSSDNIPGLEGFGPKTATSLLQEFGSLDAILAHPEKVKGEKKQEILRTQKHVALMSRELATLDTKVEIPHDTKFYEIKPHKPELIDFFHRMQFSTFLKETHVSKKESTADSSSYHLVDDLKKLESLLQRLEKEKSVGIDTETTDIRPMRAELVGVGFGVKEKEAWYVPLNGELGEKTVVAALKEFFKKAKGSFYGHNIKYDWHVLKNYGLDLEPIGFDTLLASYLLDPQNRKHNLDELALEEFQKVKIPIESLIGKGKVEISMADVPIDQVKEYCCEDIDYTTRLKNLYETRLTKQKLDRLLFDIELPLLPILARMERTGIYLDTEELAELGRTLSHDLTKAKAKIFKEVGEEFNINSPKQLSEVLYQKLGLKPPAKKKTEFATGADVLEELSEENPIARHILEYRSLEKLRSTYVESLPEEVNPKTGRIHCTFNQSVAATGRLSCQNPNLQNIPVRTKEGNAIRSCFKPSRKGWSFLAGDYSQIELRLLAHFSEDPELIHAFKTGRDIHIHTASLVCGVPDKEVTSEMRQMAKTVNFGIIYGQGPFSLSRQLHISHKEASEFIKTYFERYPRVLDYLEFCKESARKTGLSRTLTGRLRPIPELTNKNPSIRAAAERLAVNTPLQGTAADLIKLAMIEIDSTIRDKKLEGKMLLQIHDELVFEIPDSEVDTFTHLVKNKMEHVLKLNVPIEVKIAVGKNWGEC